MKNLLRQLRKVDFQAILSLIAMGIVISIRSKIDMLIVKINNTDVERIIVITIIILTLAIPIVLLLKNNNLLLTI